jgi:hypothetical protein
MEALGEEVARGRARARGISSHHPRVLLAAMASGTCDVVMFPLGPFVARGYVAEVLPRARAAGVGTICFKAFGAGKLLGDTEGYGRPLPARPGGGAAPGLPRLTVEECVRYTLTLDPDVALLGLGSRHEQEAAFAAAERFVPMTRPEQDDVRFRAWEALKEKGEAWWNPPPLS